MSNSEQPPIEEGSIGIEEGSTVSLYFSLALANGDIIDSNFEREAASFKLGDGSMLPGFEQLLLGLKAEEEIEKKVPPEQAFGLVNPENQQRFPIAKFRHLLEDDLVPTEVGSVISFKDPGGFNLPGVVSEISEESIHIDFNHPLAGKELVFRARIVSVLKPDAEALEIKF